VEHRPRLGTDRLLTILTGGKPHPDPEVAKSSTWRGVPGRRLGGAHSKDLGFSKWKMREAITNDKGGYVKGTTGAHRKNNVERTDVGGRYHSANQGQELRRLPQRGKGHPPPGARGTRKTILPGTDYRDELCKGPSRSQSIRGGNKTKGTFVFQIPRQRRFRSQRRNT